MKVTELSRKQLIELKQRLYMEENENVSYGELAEIDNIVEDSEVFERYEDTEFYEEDFFAE